MVFTKIETILLFAGIWNLHTFYTPQSIPFCGKINIPDNWCLWRGKFYVHPNSDRLTKSYRSFSVKMHVASSLYRKIVDILKGISNNRQLVNCPLKTYGQSIFSVNVIWTRKVNMFSKKKISLPKKKNKLQLKCLRGFLKSYWKKTKFPVFPTKNKSYVDFTELSFVH